MVRVQLLALRRPRVLVGVVLAVLALALGAVVVLVQRDGAVATAGTTASSTTTGSPATGFSTTGETTTEGSSRPPSTAVAAGPATTASPATASTAIAASTTAPAVAGDLPGVVLETAQPLDTTRWAAIATALAPMPMPSACGRPLDEPVSLPNAPRGYRGGVHQGLDFVCEQRGHDAVAARDGVVVVANHGWVEPEPAERSALLAEAQSLGRTPPWILAMLYGRFVVIDHGVVPGAGHVVSVSAHLDEIDPALRPGLRVTAGTRIGAIGDSGTDAAATGIENPRSIHLHWELLVDDVFLGAGLDPAATRALYAQLFGLT